MTRVLSRILVGWRHIFTSGVQARRRGDLRKLGTDDIVYPRMADEFFELILGGLERSVDARINGVVPAERVVDLQFDALMTDPIGAAKSVYSAFGWPFSAEVEDAMSTFLRTHVREGHGHPYTFEATGLSLSAVRDRTARYTEYFDVDQELS